VGDQRCKIGIGLDTLERQRMEDALRRSQGRLRAAVDLLALGLYDWDPQTNALEWDARVKAIWGLPADAHVDYEVWRAHVHPDDLDRVLAAVEKCADPGGDGVYDVEYRVIGADGVERWVATRGKTSFQAGKPVAFAGIALDITARKRADERLRESEARLSAILAQLPVGVALLDREGRFILHGGLLGCLWDQTIPSRDPRLATKWRSYDSEGRLLDPSRYPGARALRGETVAPGIDFMHTAAAGRDVWIRVAAAPFRNADGRIEGAVAILENVDHEKRAEQAIRESEERFRQFAEYSSNVIWMLSLEDRRLEYLSPAYDNIWGQSRDLSLGYWIETIHLDDREQAAAALDRASLGEVIVREYRIVRPDGAMRSIRETLFPMRDRRGHLQRIGGITQDVTIRTGSLVYLIDGDETSRANLQLMILRAGYSVKSFVSGSDFLAVAPVLALGCVVVDSRSPAAGGLTVPRQLRANGSQLPVLMAGTSHGNVALAVAAMKAGAVDWIEMPCEPDVLLGAIAAALADIRDATAKKREVELARARIAGMSMRERQVLEGLLAGHTNKMIGRDLGISPRTVELHRANVMEKLGAQTLTEAVLLTAAAGIPPASQRIRHGPAR
jgi:PAS domain S-box-containing protein